MQVRSLEERLLESKFWKISNVVDKPNSSKRERKINKVLNEFFRDNDPKVKVLTSVAREDQCPGFKCDEFFCASSTAGILNFVLTNNAWKRRQPKEENIRMIIQFVSHEYAHAKQYFKCLDNERIARCFSFSLSDWLVEIQKRILETSQVQKFHREADTSNIVIQQSYHDKPIEIDAYAYEFVCSMIFDKFNNIAEYRKYLVDKKVNSHERLISRYFRRNDPLHNYKSEKKFMKRVVKYKQELRLV